MERCTVSFLVRFTFEPREMDDVEQQTRRGHVQHVQSGLEMRFLNLEALRDFMESVTVRALLAPSVVRAESGD